MRGEAEQGHEKAATARGCSIARVRAVEGEHGLAGARSWGLRKAGARILKTFFCIIGYISCCMGPPSVARAMVRRELLQNVGDGKAAARGGALVPKLATLYYSDAAGLFSGGLLDDSVRL